MPCSPSRRRSPRSSVAQRTAAANPSASTPTRVASAATASTVAADESADGELLQALEPLARRLLALEEARALERLRGVMGEHGEEHPLVLVEGARVREDERHAGDGAAMRDQRQARIGELA